MADMLNNLYGNPHSASPSSQLSTNRIEDARLKVLQFFNADPEDFDVVFVANATAGVKLVMDAFRSNSGGFTYGYHRDSHTSVVGVRENAVSSRCLDDGDIESFLAGSRPLFEVEVGLNLFAYPAQSNLDGRRLPMSWSNAIREIQHSGGSRFYTLLDASAFVSTSQLDLSNASSAPDFTVLSFYKIFGFPDLGALIIRRESGSILRERKYFGGGTVDVVLCSNEQWHAPKSQSLHDSLEDGTLPFHSILALDAAIDTHRNLYGSMDKIASHTMYLAQKLFDGLQSLRHVNMQPVCVMYSQPPCSRNTQGPVVAFNLKNSSAGWVSNTEFEKLASVRNFHVRTGGLCNPGGLAKSLNLEAWEMTRNFSAGFRCGAEADIYAGKITGMIRASVGAMSTTSDIEAFVSFVREFYAESLPRASPNPDATQEKSAELFVESLTIFPIKSCGGMNILPGIDWEVRPEGLVWDREWCLVHRGTGQALSQKRHPRMALIRPSLDFDAGVLRVRCHNSQPQGVIQEICVPLSANPALYIGSLSSRVCGDAIVARTYSSQGINDFFSRFLGVTCALARFPAGGSGLGSRHAKAHMQNHQRPKEGALGDALLGPPLLPTPPDSDNESPKRPILLSNESPILAISRSSIEALNKEIVKTGGKRASASVFRPNIVLACSYLDQQKPYDEDHWTGLRIGQQDFQMLGSCRRCHMICVDQETAERDKEPFTTLAKTRRFESKIFFGSHMCHISSKGVTKESQFPTIRVGDVVTIARDD